MRVGLSWVEVTEVAERTLRWAQIREEKRGGPGLISTSPESRRRQHKRKLVDFGGEKHIQDLPVTVSLIKWDSEILSREWHTDDLGMGGNKNLGGECVGGWEEHSGWKIDMQMNKMSMQMDKTCKEWNRFR